MTDYCTVSFSWEPDKDPNRVVEYKFPSGDADEPDHGRQHSRDHFFVLGQVGGDRFQVTHYPSDIPVTHSPRGSVHSSGGAESDNIPPCILSLECKPVYIMAIKGFAIASEARTVEVYNGKDGSYLQTVRGMRDREDSEADDSKIHFMCQCTLEEPLKSINLKFLSLGPRKTFEVAHIRVMMEPCSAYGGDQCQGAGQGIDMDKLRRDVDSMGDTVSDRARSFLTTLENFQKSRQGAVDDMRHLLLDRNASGPDASSLAGITTFLAMFSGSGTGMAQPPSPPNTSAQPTAAGKPHAEGSVMNQMLSQMMSSLAVGEGGGQGEDRGEMFKLLQTVCSQVAEQRAEAVRQNLNKEEDEVFEKEKEKSETIASAELESKLDTLVEARLEAVEERLMTRVDAHLAELETKMSNKLDAVLALLQQKASQGKPS